MILVVSKAETGEKNGISTPAGFPPAQE